MSPETTSYTLESVSLHPLQCKGCPRISFTVDETGYCQACRERGIVSQQYDALSTPDYPLVSPPPSPGLSPRGGRKDDDGKLRMDLIPVKPLQRVAEVYTIGARKYGDRNWEKGIAFSRLYGAALRHLTNYWAGQQIDSDDGQHPLASVVWAALAMMELEVTRPEFDDRPKVV